MIYLFGKLKTDGLLRSEGKILDLGSGNGAISEPFFRAGYNVSLVDMDKEALEKARGRFNEFKTDGFEVINRKIEEFEFSHDYDGIIISNVLPFIKDKKKIEEILKKSFGRLDKGGFLYITLFGDKDEWNQKRGDTMSFFTKEEAISILGKPAYFSSEDYGRGTTMKGDFKVWHIFNLLYIK